MKIDDKIEKVKKLLEEANQNKKIAYGNFFKFLESYDNPKKHKKLNDAIEDLESSQGNYE